VLIEPAFVQAFHRGVAFVDRFGRQHFDVFQNAGVIGGRQDEPHGGICLQIDRQLDWVEGGVIDAQRHVTGRQVEQYAPLGIGLHFPVVGQHGDGDFFQQSPRVMLAHHCAQAVTFRAVFCPGRQAENTQQPYDQQGFNRSHSWSVLQ